VKDDVTILVEGEACLKMLFANRLISLAYNKRQGEVAKKKKTVILTRQYADQITDDSLVRQENKNAIAGQKFTGYATLPVRMLKEEVTVALKHGLVWLEKRSASLWVAHMAESRPENPTSLWEYPTNVMEKATVRVFEDLWSRGWIITLGTSFGCDYLAYEADPGVVHSSFLILIDAKRSYETSLPSIMNGIMALATKVRKRALFATVQEDTVNYTSYESCWFRRTEFQQGKKLEEDEVAPMDESETGCNVFV